MHWLHWLKSLVTDPPPEIALEVSARGIAWSPVRHPHVEWTPLPEGALEVSPLENNVRDPAAFAAAVSAAAGNGEGRGRRRRAALILPDYCARVTVLDFDSFPEEPEEQIQLVRFRIRRVVPFDIENAVVACYPQPRQDGSRRIDVVAAVVNMEVAAHYESPFRAAGLHCGFVTLSALAALSLPPAGEPMQASPRVVAKLGGGSLAVSLLEDTRLRLYRCVQLGEDGLEEATAVLATTLAYAEDELGGRAAAMQVCGLDRSQSHWMERWRGEFGIPICGVRGRLGEPSAGNAGLHGYLESLEAA
jgi:type IV pilus assembly protein PilM